MKHVLLDDTNHIVAITATLPEDCNYPDDFALVELGDFEPDPLQDLYDYVYVDGEFVLDEAAIEERELNRPYMPSEVLIAMFTESPEMLDTFSDDTLAHMAPYMAEWSVDKAYAIGDKVQYLSIPYRCVQAHTSSETYTPDVAVSLWARILPGQGGDIGDWEQPGSTNPYMKGDKVRHNGHIWESAIDYNVYEPGVAGWTCLDPDSEPEPTPEPEPEPTPEPSDIPVWEQPGSTNPYMKGDRVHFPTADDPVYESDYDNNIWAPNVFGWHVVEAD